jgi:hypothetical protein
MTTEDDDIPEDELLSLPSDRISSLSRLWSVRAGMLHVKQLDELTAERAGTARPFMLFPDRDPKRREEEERRRALLAYEQAMQDIRDRSDRLLVRIDEQRHELDNRRKEMEGRALHLHDGRRAWLDGDRFRDDSGALLQGRDHSEAAALAEQHPDAPTWGEREKLRQQIAEADRMSERIHEIRKAANQPGQDAPALDAELSGYEKDVQQKAEARAREMRSSPEDYGDADYMNAFNAAAGATTAPEPTDKKETETASSKPPRPAGSKFNIG